MPSFDIVSELEIFEVNHAVQNTQKEIATRFDFRGQDVSIELNEKNKEIKISTESDFQCEQVYTMLENHFFKRKVDIQALDPQKMTASGKNVLQVVKLKDGLDSDTAKKINKAIKESGIKVQSSIQGDKIRYLQVSHSEVVVKIENHRAMQNHIGQLHACAMALIAETATGFVTGMNVPDHCIVLIKSMHVDFKRPSKGAMTATATLTPEQQQLMQTTAKGETLVSVTVMDESGEAPVQCEMLWAWLDKASLKK